MENAFNVVVMKHGDPDTEIITRDDFVKALNATGEPLEQQQIHKCLCALMGESRHFDPEASNFSFLPEVSTFFCVAHGLMSVLCLSVENQL